MSGRVRGTAEEGNRTPKPFRAEDFESSASASSATSARAKRTRSSRRAPAVEPSGRVLLRVLQTESSDMTMRDRASREDSDSLVNLNARVPKHLWRRVRLQCVREERLLRSFITDALREYLRDRVGRRN
jgi:hypothetical protein